MLDRYKNVLVLENDLHMPSVLVDALTGCDLPVSTWYNFNNTTEDKTHAHLLAGDGTLVVTNPSFVGYSLEGEIHFFMKMKEMDVRVDLCVFYYPDFYWYLLKWLNDYTCNKAKRQRRLEVLIDALEYHNVYYVPSGDWHRRDTMGRAVKITRETIMENHVVVGEDATIKATGAVYPVYSVSIDDERPEDSFVTLRIPEDYNNRFKLHEIAQLLTN